jgi:Raf kinase inhibitor-like YbhB/YbcL family protein
MEQTGTRQEEHAIAARRLGLGAPTLTVDSTAFKRNQPIPRKHAGAHGRSPELTWSAPPPGTREIVVLVEDPDAPTPKPFVHWIVIGVPPDVRELVEGLPASSVPLASGAVQGRNDMHREGYYGSEPPPGHGVHHYHFQIFAVDQPLELQAPVDRDQLLEALRGQVLAWGELVGTYER